MPSPLSRKKRTSTKKPGISRQRNFTPALKAVKSLVDDLADSEDPEDQKIKSKIAEIGERTKPSLTRNFAGSQANTSLGHERTSKNKLQTMSPDSFFKMNGLLGRFDSDSESEDNGDGSGEEQTGTRILTEVERLEEVQTTLEERIKQTKELLQRTDRTRNQRLHGQQKLHRLELKLEMLEQRLEIERAGKSRWTFVRRVLKKSKVGFHSSELLNRKVPLGLLAASPDTRPHLADVVLQEMERKADIQLNNNPPQKPKKAFKSKELHEFQQSLDDDEAQPQSQGAESGIDTGFEVETAKDANSGWRKIGSGDEQLQESFKKEQRSDRKEIDKGWLRISDRPQGFIKRVEDFSDTKSREAWVNINEQGRHIFARKVFRSHVNGDSFLSRSLDGRGNTLNVRGQQLSIDGRRSFNGSEETLLGSKDKVKERQMGSISSSQSPRTAKVVKMDIVGGTTSFLPPIPKSEAKKRPKEEQVEKIKDENDGEQQKERILLIPNQKRMAKKRIEIYLKQLEFVKSHRLDQKEILKNVVSAVDDYHSDKVAQEREAKTTPRNTLYLIGALSKNHLRPPTAPPK